MVPTPQRNWLRFWLLVSNLGFPVAMFSSGFRIWWIIAGAAVVHALLIYALVTPQCSWLGPVLTKFRSEGRQVWLTIDDGPDGDSSIELAEELQRRNVAATFFVKGRNLERYRSQAVRVSELGHGLANHTQNHPALSFWCLSPWALRREVEQCNQNLASCGVHERRWFRPPVGLKHVWLHRTIARSGMRVVAWSVRGYDGLGCNPEAVAQRVARKVFPGSIVLLHEGRAGNMEGILRVTQALQDLGYEFVIPRPDQLV